MESIEIDVVDKKLLADAFNEGGYVLDFTDDSFDSFTIDSVNVAVKSQYRLSKAKSLAKFTQEGDPYKVLKLYADLIAYFEIRYAQEVLDKTERALKILSLKDILNKYRASGLGDFQTPKLARIHSEYIRKTVERANRHISEGEYDSALTNARTLLEEVFCFVLEKKGVSKSKNLDIFSLYNEVKSVYGLRQNNEYDKRVNGLLSGLEKILQSISEMRNAQSDAHGLGSRRLKIKSHHARLFVNASHVMADFILAVAV